MAYQNSSYSMPKVDANLNSKQIAVSLTLKLFCKNVIMNSAYSSIKFLRTARSLAYANINRLFFHT